MDGETGKLKADLVDSYWDNNTIAVSFYDVNVLVYGILRIIYIKHLGS